ncbi:MAG: DUF2934 domain-containing protein [Xanthobacteraceae bacterium]
MNAESTLSLSELPYYAMLTAIVTVAPHFNDPHHAAIAEAAYFRAERRGFAPGHELEDWLAAEREIEGRLIGEGRIF